MRTVFELVIRKKSILHKINIFSIFWSNNGHVLGYVADTIFAVTGNTEEQIDDKLWKHVYIKLLPYYDFNYNTMEFHVYEKDLLTHGASAGIEI